MASRDQSSVQLPGEVVILDMRSATYFGLDPVGASIWALVQQPITVSAICDALMAEYEVSRERCEASVLRLLGELAGHGLVTAAQGRQQPAPGGGSRVVSGIVGLVHLDGRDADATVLHTLVTAGAFRGPDRQDMHVQGQAGFGHTALRTVEDTDADVQPCAMDGAIITADARIDDRATLRAALRAQGRAVTTSATDAQLILHAWHAWGTACTDHLLGDFAFAVWDAGRQTLFCARDPFGVKPFYYARCRDVVVFANTLDVVLAHPAVTDAVNERAIGDFLLIGSNADPATTAYRDIQRLPAGHRLVVSGAARSLTVTRWWSMPVPEPIRYRRAGEYVEHFDVLLRSAVRDRLRVPQASVFISGGIDSTALAATVRAVRTAVGEPLGLMGVTCADRGDARGRAELELATLAAEHLGMPLRVVDAVRGASPLSPPEPVDDPDAALRIALLSEASRHGRVAFNGEDGDALLEPSTPRESAQQFGALATIRAVATYILRQHRVPYAGIHLRERLGHGRERTEVPAWVAEDFANRVGLRERSAELDREAVVRRHPVRSLACRSFASPAWPQFLESLDPGRTGVPVEVRLPLIDVRLLGFVFAIPSTPWCEQKHLLRRTMQGRLPDAVVTRPKRSGSMPSALEADTLQTAADALSGMPVDLDSFIRREIVSKSLPAGRDAIAASRPRLLGEWLRRRRLPSPTMRSI